MSPRYRRPPLTEADIWQDGPPVKLRDLAAISGLTTQTIRLDILSGELAATKRPPRNAPYRVTRAEARRWLQPILGTHRRAG